MINRSAITVRARQPFLDWLLKLPDPTGTKTTLEEINEDRTVYLLPEYDHDDEREDLLTHFFDMLFESQLEAWWTDDAQWPLVRDLKTFNEWFEVEHHSIIEDLAAEPLTDDDDLADE